MIAKLNIYEKALKAIKQSWGLLEDHPVLLMPLIFFAFNLSVRMTTTFLLLDEQKMDPETSLVTRKELAT